MTTNPKTITIDSLCELGTEDQRRAYNRLCQAYRKEYDEACEPYRVTCSNAIHEAWEAFAKACGQGGWDQNAYLQYQGAYGKACDQERAACAPHLKAYQEACAKAFVAACSAE